MALGSALQSRTGLLLSITQEYYCFLELCLPIQLQLVPRNHNSGASQLIMLNVILVQAYIISSNKNNLDYKTAR